MATALPAQGFEAGVRAYYWFPSLDGDIKYSDNSLAGTKLDLEEDLGFDDEYYPFVDIHAGYRTFFVDVDTNDLELNYDTSGLYAGISVSF